MDKKTLRAILIDDEKKGISALKLLMEKFIPEVKIIAECLKAADAIPLIENDKPEIVFLDIDMPGMNGFEMLEKLTWKNFNLVFTTAHQEYGLKALKNNAIDYLLKPISHKDLILTVERIKEKLNQQTVTLKFDYSELLQTINSTSKSRLLINSMSGVEYIDVDDLLYLESQSNYTKIMVAYGSEVITRKTLKEFENQLCVSEIDFMRVHNSYIINLNKVARYLKSSDEIVLTGELKIPLSKAKREVFFKWMNL